MAKYLITGTNRGIGLEFVKQVLAQGHDVVATCRNPENVPELRQLQQANGALRVLPLDLASAESRQVLVDALNGDAIDVLINNAGIYGPRDANLGSLRESDWAEVMLVDVIAPVLLTQALLPNLRKGTERRLAFISSKMGSISDNGSGGSYLYRTAKSALNQAVKSLAIDLQPEQFIVLTMHPGWVLTDMGGPNALIDTNTSVTGLLKVIEGARPVDSGFFFAYDGSPIAW
jgi:NAD(P)-dependent dehydrogenase (short-subunit alcohol dehydrogenase family)